GWDQRSPARRTPVHLDAVQHAVVAGEQITLGYVARDRTATTRVVHPLGLAAKGAVWYLVADTDAGLRTFRVDRISSVEPTGEPGSSGTSRHPRGDRRRALGDLFVAHPSPTPGRNGRHSARSHPTFVGPDPPNIRWAGFSRGRRRRCCRRWRPGPAAVRSGRGT